MTVMLITFLENFLEDGLMEVAVKNPQIIKKVEFQAIKIFETESLEELRTELRRSWAHDALRPDGPGTWYRTFRDMGAPSLEEKVVQSLQHMWDTRNLIVHGVIADVAYAKKYSNRGAKVGVEVKVNLHSFAEWLIPLKQFVEWVDTFVFNYGKRKTPP
jgi:hypothetical protein